MDPNTAVNKTRRQSNCQCEYKNKLTDRVEDGPVVGANGDFQVARDDGGGENCDSDREQVPLLTIRRARLRVAQYGEAREEAPHGMPRRGDQPHERVE